MEAVDVGQQRRGELAGRGAACPFTFDTGQVMVGLLAGVVSVNTSWPVLFNAVIAPPLVTVHALAAARAVRRRLR
ncbi:MAG: hypothetical protein LBI49_07960 [Nocardiopsaceae bacterium]|nr:hypothetical protein [Nocardiopsaceae bacterium]